MAVTPIKSKLGGSAAPAVAGISLAPSTFVEGGGLVGDVDVEVTDAQFVMFDYNGTIAVPVPALGLSLKEINGEKTHDQYFSCGDAEQFAPSSDGSSLIPTGDRTSINTSSKAAMFLISMVNAGVPETLLASGNIKDIIGLRVHVIRVASPKRAGLTNQKEGATDLTVSKLIALPGETVKAPAKTGLGATKPNGAAKAVAVAPVASASTSAEVDPALAEATAAEVVALLAANDGTILHKNVSAALFKQIDKANPLRAAITKLAFDKDWLASVAEEAGFTFDGTTLSM